MKKDNKGIINKPLLISIIVIILVLGVGIFVFTNKSEASTSNKSLVEAEELLYTTFENFNDFSTDTFNSEEFKTYTAITKTNFKTKDYKCNELFSNLKPWGEVPDDKSWEIDFNGNGLLVLCSDYEEKKYFTYDDVNKSYKTLFGKNKDASKKNVAYGLSNLYGYSSLKDIYVPLSSEGGSYGNMPVYGIVDYKKENDKMYIEFVYGVVSYDEKDNKVLNLKNGTKKQITDEEIKDSNTYKKYIDNLDKYEFIFKMEDGNYIFEVVNAL